MVACVARYGHHPKPTSASRRCTLTRSTTVTVPSWVGPHEVETIGAESKGAHHGRITAALNERDSGILIASFEEREATGIVLSR